MTVGSRKIISELNIIIRIIENKNYYMAMIFEEFI